VLCLVLTRQAVESVLREAPEGRKYIMKTIGVVDAVRADMTLLPKATWEETLQHIGKLPISKKVPWILQQYIDGPEYCTHAVIVHGKVRAFVACPSAELLMHYESLPPGSPLWNAMLDFTKAVARVGGADFSGHMSFDFMIPKKSMNGDSLDKALLANSEIYPIECNPRAHTAVALFNSTPDMAHAYLAVTERHFKEDGDASPEPVIVIPAAKDKYYWIGHDLFTRLILPVLALLRLQVGISEVVEKVKELITHVIHWKDGTFEIWDPMPFWLLYHACWPSEFATHAARRRADIFQPNYLRKV
jgi:catechol O-methyltransferase